MELEKAKWIGKSKVYKIYKKFFFTDEINTNGGKMSSYAAKMGQMSEFLNFSFFILISKIHMFEFINIFGFGA